MAWPAIAARVALVVGRQIIKRPITSSIGAIIGYEYVTSDGEVLGVIDSDDIEDFEDAVTDLGKDIVLGAGQAVGGFTLDVVRGLGAAVVDGVDGAYDALREKLRGKEPDVITALVIGAAVVFTAVYLYQSFKNVNDAFSQGGVQVN